MLVLMTPTVVGVIGPVSPLEVVSRLIPMYYMVKVLDMTLGGEASLSKVWSSLMVLAGSVLGLFMMVVWTIKKQGD